MSFKHSFPLYLMIVLLQVNSFALANHESLNITANTCPAPNNLHYSEKSNSVKKNNNNEDEILQLVKDYLTSGGVWVAVPLLAEIMLATGNAQIPKDSKYLKLFVKSHSGNIRKSTSEHLIERIRSLVEYHLFSALNNNHAHTEEIENYLQSKTLDIKSKISMHAIKGRKISSRVKILMDHIFDGAYKSYVNGDIEQSSLLIAYAAKLIVSLHPEFRGSEFILLNNIYRRFISKVDLDHHFKLSVVENIKYLDSSYDDYSSVKVKYCQLLNIWQIGPDADCSIYGKVKLPLTKKQKNNKSGFNKRHAVVGVGLTLPVLLGGLVSDDTHVIPKVGVKFFSDIFSKSTTKADITKTASSTQKYIQSFVAKHKEKSSNVDTSHADQVNKELLTRSAILLSEQASFIRANIQRSLAIMMPRFFKAFEYNLAGDTDNAAKQLAIAALYMRQNTVESHYDDNFIAEAAQAFLLTIEKSESFADLVYSFIEEIDTEIANSESVQKHYQQLLSAWNIN